MISERHAELSKADDAVGEFEKSLVEVGSLLMADTESFEVMEPGGGPLDDTAGVAEAGAAGQRRIGRSGL